MVKSKSIFNLLRANRDSCEMSIDIEKLIKIDHSNPIYYIGSSTKKTESGEVVASFFEFRFILFFLDRKRKKYWYAFNLLKASR